MAKYWSPWVEELRIVILKYARYLFASLVLSLLLFANIAAIMVILRAMKGLIEQCR